MNNTSFALKLGNKKAVIFSLGKKENTSIAITANMFELNTIYGSVVTEKIAGILSNANSKSVNSIVIRAPKSAVKTVFH